MNNYIPFLKFKSNEIGALSSLSSEIKKRAYPFLDLPKKSFESEAAFISSIEKNKKSVSKHLAEFPAFFLDNYDIDDSLSVGGENNYNAVIDAFRDSPKFVPVVGLDRSDARNEIVFRRKAQGAIQSNNIVVRLQPEDFQSFALIEAEIISLQQQGQGLFNGWTLVLDNRVCLNLDTSARGNEIGQFINAATQRLQPQAFIITGSSISASIRDILKVQSEIHHPREEIAIYRTAVQCGAPNVYLGDYTVVSPFYSELEIPAEAMQNVTAAKAIYSYGDTHYIARGGALKTHSRGFYQYNDIAEHITKQEFYRGPEYSFGDNFIMEKANGIGKKVTPGSILKPTINLHMTYMFNSFPG